MLFSGKVDEGVVFGADEERNGSLVETSTLSIPLLDGIQCALSRQVKHEEDSNGIVADERKHVDKLSQ